MDTNKIPLSRPHVTKAHIIQSAMAGSYIFIVFLLMHSLHSELAVASLGASVFIVFTFPTAQSSRSQHLIGGYSLGGLSGLLCYGLSMLFYDRLPIPSYIPACALAIFLVMLLMTILNLKHPPSAALAVSITISSNPFVLAFSGLVCIITLCVLKKFIIKHLRNL